MAFSLFSFMVANPMVKKTMLKKKKKKGMDDTYFNEWSPHEQDF